MASRCFSILDELLSYRVATAGHRRSHVVGRRISLGLYTAQVRYLLQFPAGLVELVEEVVQDELTGVRFLYRDDSALLFETRDRIRSAKDVQYAKNVFLVHAETKRRVLSSSLLALADAVPSLRGNKSQGFRLMYHVDGQLVSPEPRAARALQAAVARSSGLQLMPRGQCQEYWVIGRRESSAFYFVERLPSPDQSKRARGSLSTELAALLVAASQPRADDVFLDPFAGTGALVRARLRTSARSVIYNDVELDSYRQSFPPTTDRVVRFLGEDALRLPSVESGVVDVIVTDPPWGEFDGSMPDPREFFGQMADTFTRVLKPNLNRVVVLVNRRNEEVLSDALVASSMKITDSFRLLVNGHPASAIRARTV